MARNRCSWRIRSNFEREEVPRSDPIKISQLAYLISRLLIFSGLVSCGVCSNDRRETRHVSPRSRTNPRSRNRSVYFPGVAACRFIYLRFTRFVLGLYWNAALIRELLSEWSLDEILFVFDFSTHSLLIWNLVLFRQIFTGTEYAIRHSINLYTLTIRHAYNT